MSMEVFKEKKVKEGREEEEEHALAKHKR